MLDRLTPNGFTMSFSLENPRVLERLLDEPYRFQFVQAVRLLERWFTEHGGAQLRHVVPYRIAFRTTLTTTFPPSEIEKALSFDDAGEDLTDKAARIGAMMAGKISKVDLTPAFFGLLGGQGALPLRYTEQIASSDWSSPDRPSQAFFDIFSNRSTALFYAAWKKYRLPLHYELDRNERYLPILQALAGVADTSAREALREEPGALADDAVAGHSAAVRHRAVSVVYLRRTLSEYFGIPIQIEQFIGNKYRVPPEKQSSTGIGNMALGSTAMLGEHIWMRHARIRLVLGPLSASQYEEFLPNSASMFVLNRLLQLLIGITLEAEVRPVLKRDEVQPLRLGSNGRVGYDAFLATRPSQTDRSDMRYTLNELSIASSEQDAGTA